MSIHHPLKALVCTSRVYTKMCSMLWIGFISTRFAPKVSTARDRRGARTSGSGENIGSQRMDVPKSSCSQRRRCSLENTDPCREKHNKNMSVSIALFSGFGRFKVSIGLHGLHGQVNSQRLHTAPMFRPLLWMFSSKKTPVFVGDKNT